MPSAALALFDWFFTALHLAVVLGFVLLWIPRRTARLHRHLVVLTAFSWLILGYTRGFGYCVLTDLHWRVKHARGATRLPGSFIKYVGDFVTGGDLPPKFVDQVATTAFVIGVVAAIARWVQEKRDRARAITGTSASSQIP